jgi:hypothetical protein
MPITPIANRTSRKIFCIGYPPCRIGSLSSNERLLPPKQFCSRSFVLRSSRRCWVPRWRISSTFWLREASKLRLLFARYPAVEDRPPPRTKLVPESRESLIGWDFGVSAVRLTHWPEVPPRLPEYPREMNLSNDIENARSKTLAQSPNIIGHNYHDVT